MALVFGFVGVTGGAAFAGKPTVAILGVEVTDPSNQGIDPASTDVAKGLTEGLRSRAKAGTGPLTFAPGSEKELIDEKFMTGCDNEANACMAKIGSDLTADQLMFGNIQKKSTGYLVTMKLLGVAGKNIIRSVNETIPYGEAQGASLQSWAKRIYGKLTGDTSGGMLVIKANVERGTVLIEGEPKGNLVGGRATISGLPEGRYKLAIEAEGYQRFESNITVTAGDTVNVGANLDPSGLKGTVTVPTGDHTTEPAKNPSNGETTHTQEGTVSDSNTNIWKPIAVASLIVAAGGAALLVGGDIEESNNAKNAHFGSGVGNSQCGNAMYDNGSGTADQKAFHSACSDYTYTKIGGGVLAGAGVIAAVSIVLALHHHDDEHPTQTAGRRKHHDQFAITPVVGPQGAGATFALEW